MDKRMFTIAQSTIGGILVLDIVSAKSRDQDRTSMIAEKLFQIITASDCRQIILDLKGISFITSDVIGQLIMLHKKCQANNYQLKLCGAESDNRLALDMVRFDQLVDTYEHKAHAIAAFKLGEPPAVTEAVDEVSADDCLERARAGDLDAQYRYGKCLETGRGVAQDFHAALEWYEKAASQNHVDAQHAPGVAYAYGIGVPQNFEKAFDWYKKAADHGHAEAQYWIGVSMQYGLIDEVDIGRAIKWYTEAAEQGYSPAYDAIAELKRSS